MDDAIKTIEIKLKGDPNSVTQVLIVSNDHMSNHDLFDCLTRKRTFKMHHESYGFREMSIKWNYLGSSNNNFGIFWTRSIYSNRIVASLTDELMQQVSTSGLDIHYLVTTPYVYREKLTNLVLKSSIQS